MKINDFDKLCEEIHGKRPPRKIILTNYPYYMIKICLNSMDYKVYEIDTERYLFYYNRKQGETAFITAEGVDKLLLYKIISRY